MMHIYGEAIHRIEGTLKHASIKKSHIAQAFDVYASRSEESIDQFLFEMYRFYNNNVHCCSAMASLIWGNRAVQACRKAFESNNGFGVKTGDAIFGFGFTVEEAFHQYQKAFRAVEDSERRGASTPSFIYTV